MQPDEFRDLMVRPEAGDEMVFQIERANPDDGSTTFSAEALEGLTENVTTFVAARTLARWEQTGRGPQKVTARVVLDWDDDSDLEEGPPWWHLDDKGMTPLDGGDRIKAATK